MRIRLAVISVVLLASCASGNDRQEAAATSTSSTTTTSTTIEPTTTEEPTTTKAKIDSAVRTGCKELVDAKDDDGIRRAIVFFSLSANPDFSVPADEFVEADNGGDDRAAFAALADLNIACHNAGLLG
jgi:hypothetical protein